MIHTFLKVKLKILKLSSFRNILKLKARFSANNEVGICFKCDIECVLKPNVCKQWDPVNVQKHLNIEIKTVGKRKLLPNV